MTEQAILHEVMRALAGRSDLRLWRNNTGALVTIDGRFVRFGLAGSADLLGIMKGGRFLAIEVKTPTGKQSADQVAFQKMINRFGGLYIVARSAQDAVEAIDREVKQ